MAQSRDENNGTGWVFFAGYLMIVAGFFQMIAGFVALLKPSLYIATENHLSLLDYNQWGWIHIIVGLILALSAGSLFAGRLWGRFIAIALATLSAIVNFGFIWAYPVWSLLIIAIDIMVIYAVAVYGGDRELS
jgi:hypothetical protein